ncbi:MAG TPA: GAF domain-containing sensor histidine kinase [Dehalococcoidia bacterium]|nr:GAF domain-containing sensor histidine kinase [Dehalococcoidia bacterium]
MSLQQLRWLTIVAAISFLLAVQAVAMGFVMPSFGRIYGHAVSVSAISIGVVIFTVAIYRLIESMQRRIVRQNEELSAVNAVSAAVAGSLDLDRSMTDALSNVMQVTRASAGQIVVQTNGGSSARSFSEGHAADLSLLQRLAAGETTPAPGTTFASIPLESHGRGFGTLTLLARRDVGLEAALSEGLLTGIGAQIAVAVRAAVLYGDVLRREKESQALYEIAVDITTFKEGEGILPSIVERAREMIGGDTAALCLTGGETGGVVLTARSGRSDVFRTRASTWWPLTPLEAPPNGREGQLASCPLAKAPSPLIHSSLRIGQDSIGELCVSSSEPRTFSPEDQRLLDAMADLAAIAVQKATLLQKERQVAVLEERERLSREMHDSLAQVLGYLHLKAQDTQRALKRDDLPKVGEELEDMAAVAHEAYADVREAIIGLRAPVMPDGGVTATLRDYLAKYSRRANIHAELVVEGDWRPRFSPDVAVQLVRVVQEALTNVRKHANAEWARVRIGRSQGEAAIVVEDNGCGFNTDLLRETDVLSFGLRTMRERVERVGGRFAVDSVPGEGTRVQIFLPVNGGHENDSG